MRKGSLSYSAAFDDGTEQPVPRHIRLIAIVFRSIFIISLLIVTAWVSKPQFGSTWLEHFSVGDFVRVALGAAACLWMFVNLFILPKDARGYWTWISIGLAFIPLALLCWIVFF